MAAGRCAGCDKSFSSIKSARAHCAACEQFAELYRTDPERALPPKEYEAYFTQKKATDEAQMDRAEKTFNARQWFQTEGERKHVLERARWESEASKGIATGDRAVRVPAPATGALRPSRAKADSPAVNAFIQDLSK